MGGGGGVQRPVGVLMSPKKQVHSAQARVRGQNALEYLYAESYIDKHTYLALKMHFSLPFFADYRRIDSYVHWYIYSSRYIHT